MTLMEWVVQILAVVTDVLSGNITDLEAKAKVAELSAIDAGVDALEKAKLGS